MSAPEPGLSARTPEAVSSTSRRRCGAGQLLRAQSASFCCRSGATTGRSPSVKRLTATMLLPRISATTARPRRASPRLDVTAQRTQRGGSGSCGTGWTRRRTAARRTCRGEADLLAGRGRGGLRHGQQRLMKSGAGSTSAMPRESVRRALRASSTSRAHCGQAATCARHRSRSARPSWLSTRALTHSPRCALTQLRLLPSHRRAARRCRQQGVVSSPATTCRCGARSARASRSWERARWMRERTVPSLMPR